MASQGLTLTQISGVVDNTAITGNGSYTVGVSETITNNSDTYNSIMVNITFSDLKAVGTDADPNVLPFAFINIIVETETSNNVWVPIGSNFEPFLRESQGATHQIVVQPNVFNIDEGVPVDYWDGQQVSKRISRQQGRLGSKTRVRVEIIETQFGTNNAFKSVNLQSDCEVYDV